jgi:tRNA dimethylallyltransferase
VKQLIVIGGATATGKSALAIRLARHFNTEILSADSRQFYREMSIGTAKPSAAELAAVPHHFIDSLHVTDFYSVGDFERDALALLDKLFQTRDHAILVGGSGLFIQAICKGLDNFPEVPPEIRQQVSDGDLPWLQRELELRDPAYYEVVDRQNPARLRRALEVSLASGQPYSLFLNRHQTARPFVPALVLLDLPRPELYTRIETRVDQMIHGGLEAEARHLLPFRNLPALKTVGYEEFFDCFDGTVSREVAIDKIKQHTRNYAKRQATWFRKHGEWSLFHPDAYDDILKFLA